MNLPDPGKEAATNRYYSLGTAFIILLSAYAFQHDTNLFGKDRLLSDPPEIAWLGEEPPRYGVFAPTHTIEIITANSSTFKVGRRGTFKVIASGMPTPTISLTAGTLPAGLIFRDNGNGTATISGTPFAGTDGQYELTFTAQNGKGADETQSFTLMVHQVPAITSATTVTFPLGQTRRFTITATGYPTPKIKETGELPSGVTFVDKGDGSATLSGTPDAGMGGQYRLTITAANGATPDAVQNFSLWVGESPVITSETSATFSVEKVGSYTVKTTGQPAPEISLTGELPSGVAFVDNGDGTATLSGTPEAGTGGQYRLTITAANGATPDATQKFSLTIIGCQSLVIKTQPENVSGCTGSAFNLSVSVTGEEPIHYQWYKGAAGNIKIPVGTDSATFKISEAEEDDSYWVRASNACGSVDSTESSVKLYTSPEITTSPSGKKIAVGGTAVVTVAAVGGLKLHYQWYQGQVGDTSHPVGTDSAALTLPGLIKTTAYWVKVGNDCGKTASSAATIEVSGKENSHNRHIRCNCATMGDSAVPLADIFLILALLGVVGLVPVREF